MKKGFVAGLITTGCVSILAGAAWIEMFVAQPTRYRIGAVGTHFR
ncbi:MAG TPA: hypothetical protein VGJ87_25340 [Roseiflexaceae bacterium]|jgi:hypothetical protein